VGFKLFIHLKQTAMSNTNKPTLDIIKSIFDLTIVEDDEKNEITFTGILKDKSDIEVRIHLSFAHSVQSMLSRQGIVDASLWVKVNGNTALYEIHMTKKDMKEVGGFLFEYNAQVQDQLDREAEETLMKNINPTKK
jgi:hypothetical protein